MPDTPESQASNRKAEVAAIVLIYVFIAFIGGCLALGAFKLADWLF